MPCRFIHCSAPSITMDEYPLRRRCFQVPTPVTLAATTLAPPIRMSCSTKQHQETHSPPALASCHAKALSQPGQALNVLLVGCWQPGRERATDQGKPGLTSTSSMVQIARPCSGCILSNFPSSFTRRFLWVLVPTPFVALSRSPAGKDPCHGGNSVPESAGKLAVADDSAAPGLACTAVAPSCEASARRRCSVCIRPVRLEKIVPTTPQRSVLVLRLGTVLYGATTPPRPGRRAPASRRADVAGRRARRAAR